KENGKGPSIRAIKDQFTRLRNAAWNQADTALVASSPRTPLQGKGLATTMTTSNSRRRNGFASSAPQTPGSNDRKSRAVKVGASAVTSPVSSFAKRAREVGEAAEEEEEEEWVPSTPTPRSK
ncbi:hypothetical protein KEM54_004923, partial [Ascosphaera aggregata]